MSLTTKNTDLLRKMYEIGTSAEKAAFILGLPRSTVRAAYQAFLTKKLDDHEEAVVRVRQPKRELGEAARSQEQARRYIEGEK